MIVVQDPNPSIYPPWFNWAPPLSVLRHPIHIIYPVLPPSDEYVVIYCDGSASTNLNKLGAGGIIWFDSTRKATCFGVALKPDSPFVTEGKTVDVGLKLAAMIKRITNVIVISDSLDFVEGMTRHSDIREDYKELIRSFNHHATVFKRCICLHAPRELLAPADAVARESKQRIHELGKPGEVVELVFSPTTRDLVNRLEKGVSVIKIEVFSTAELNDPTIKVEEKKEMVSLSRRNIL